MLLKGSNHEWIVSMMAACQARCFYKHRSALLTLSARCSKQNTPWNIHRVEVNAEITQVNIACHSYCHLLFPKSRVSCFWIKQKYNECSQISKLVLKTDLTISKGILCSIYDTPGSSLASPGFARAPRGYAWDQAWSQVIHPQLPSQRHFHF